jgi:hypothetical protein
MKGQVLTTQAMVLSRALAKASRFAKMVIVIVRLRKSSGVPLRMAKLTAAMKAGTTGLIHHLSSPLRKRKKKQR